MANEVTKIDEAKKKAAPENEHIVELSRTYDFEEGEKVSQIDFSGLEDVTAETMIKANKVLVGAGDVQVLPESSLHYALVIAAECTKYPIEFYKKLKPRDAIRIKNKISLFFNGGELD